MKKMKREYKYLLLLIGLVFTGCLIVYGPLLLKQIPFEYVTIDTREQNFAFYQEYSQIIHQFFETGKLSFYSWSDFLGTNFLVSKIFYNVTDIFTILSILLNLNFWDGLLIFQIVKCILSALGIYWLLSKYEIKPSIKVLGGISYAFCASMCYFSVYNTFTTFFTFLPIYFVAIEYFLDKKYKWLLSILTMTLAITNYYYFFSSSFFTVIYVLFRYLIKYGFKNNKDYYLLRFKQTLEMIIYYIIGVLMAGIVLYPVILYLSGNQRIGGYEFSLFYDNFKIYLQIIASLFLPLHAFKGISYSFNPGNYSLNELFMWGGTFIFIILPMVFIRKKDNVKIGSIFGIISCLIILFFPFAIQAMHGFSDISFRGTVFIQILLIIIVSMQFDSLKEITRKYIIVTSCVSIIMISFVYISPYIVNSEMIGDYSKSYLYAGFAIISIIIFALIVYINRKNKSIVWIICIFTLLEMVGVWKYALAPYSIANERHSYDFMNKATSLLEDKENGLNEYLSNLEPGNSSEYYRVYVDKMDLYWDFGQNTAMFYDLNGLSTYNSLFAPSLQKLYELVPEMLFSATTYISVNEPNVMTFVNTKYALVANESQLPIGVDWELITNNYRGWVSVYRNKNYRPLGTMYDAVKVYDDYSNTEDFLNYVLCDEEDFDEILNNLNDNSGILENIRYKDNYLLGTIESDGGFMVLTLPYDEGWNIKINGTEIEKYEVNGGFIGLTIPSGKVSLEMYYSIPGLKIGGIISGVGVAMLAIAITIDLILKRRQL